MDVGNNFSNLFEMLRFPSYLPAYYYFIYVHQCEKKATDGYFFLKTMKKVREKWRGEKRGLVDEWVNG